METVSETVPEGFLFLRGDLVGVVVCVASLLYILPKSLLNFDLRGSNRLVSIGYKIKYIKSLRPFRRCYICTSTNYATTDVGIH